MLVTTTRGSGAAAAVPARRSVAAAVCCLALALTGLDTTIVNAALPAVGRDFGAGGGAQQWVIASYTLPLAAALLGAGGVADRIGRRAVLVTAFAVFAAGSWGCSVAPGLGALIAFRAVQGLGAAGLAPAALGLISSMYPAGRERAAVIGWWDAALGLGMGAGPVLGGVLVQVGGWRAVYWATVPVGLAGVVLAALFLPECRAATSRPADVPGQVLAFASMGAAAGGIIEGPALGWSSAPVLAAFGGAALAAAGLVISSRRRAYPAINWQVFRSGETSGGLAAGLLLTAALAGFLYLMTLCLQDGREFTPARAGLVLVAMPAAMTGASAASGRLVTRTGPRLLLAAGGAGVAVACVLLHGVAGSAPAAAVAGACALFGAGGGLASAAVTNSVMAGAGRAGMASTGSAMNSSARQLGASLGVAVAGSTSAAGAGWWVLAACGAGVAAAGLAGSARKTAGAAARAMTRLACAR